MSSCSLCADIIDTDFQLETKDGESICDNCAEGLEEQAEHNHTKHREEK